MLGIRHCHGCAIDLWCGNPEAFSCEVFGEDPDQLTSFSGKHVAYRAAENIDPIALFKRLKRELESDRDQVSRRITIILKDLAGYKIFQDALFEVFPEVSGEFD